MTDEQTDTDKALAELATDKALAELEQQMVDKVAEMESAHQKTLDAMKGERVAMERKLGEQAERDQRLIRVGQQMSDKVAEMEADHQKEIAAMQDTLDAQVVELEDLELELDGGERIEPEGKGDPEQAELYRKRVLTDLLETGHFPATDHPALHDPDLSADEWKGTADEKEALVPKVEALHAHLRANPKPRGHVVVTAVSAERLR